MFNFLKNIGPGTLVAAAFIGPGTVTMCSFAGINFGFALLWAMALSIIATLVLQEMSARLGIITQKGLGDNIKEQLTNTTIRKLALALIFSAIVVGNAAYEGGNIGGASLGLEAIFGKSSWGYFPIVIGGISMMLLFLGNYKLLEKSLITLVVVMSLSFVIAAVITKPNISSIFRGIFIPGIPEGGLLTVIGLIGTTVVPYNLFLHASLVREKWNSPKDLKAARVDTFASIILGGLVSMAIIIAAASVSSPNFTNVLDLAKGLEPLYGEAARYFLGVGLFAAGVTSAITAPLAAAYVANSCLGWNAGLKDWKFRAIWMSIILFGVVLLSFDVKPLEVIRFAQIANGLLLPIIALFLLWVVNKTSVLGIYKNSLIKNILGATIVIITILLSIRTILKVFE